MKNSCVILTGSVMPNSKIQMNNNTSPMNGDQFGAVELDLNVILNYEYIKPREMHLYCSITNCNMQ